MGKVVSFIWEHFWKLVSFGVTTGFIAFVSMVQSPAQVEARISSLESQYIVLHDDSLNLRIGLGTNNVLYDKIDKKLDMLNQSIINLSARMQGNTK